MNDHNDGSGERFKPGLVVSGLAAIVLVGVSLWSNKQEEALTGAPSTVTLNAEVTAPTDFQSQDFEVSTPSMGETERAPTEMAYEGPFANPVEYGFLKGFYRTNSGYCTSVLGKSARELALDIEAAEGMRFESLKGFPDGIIVQFINGTKTVVWSREIDCKDPTYDPLKI